MKPWKLASAGAVLAAFGMLFVTVWAIRRLAPEPIHTVSTAQVA